MVFMDVTTLISYVSFAMILQRMVTMLALLYIRIRHIPVHEGKTTIV